MLSIGTLGENDCYSLRPLEGELRVSRLLLGSGGLKEYSSRLGSTLCVLSSSFFKIVVKRSIFEVVSSSNFLMFCSALSCVSIAISSFSRRRQIFLMDSLILWRVSEMSFELLIELVVGTDL